MNRKRIYSSHSHLTKVYKTWNSSDISETIERILKRTSVDENTSIEVEFRINPLVFNQSTSYWKKEQFDQLKQYLERHQYKKKEVHTIDHIYKGKDRKDIRKTISDDKSVTYLTKDRLQLFDIESTHIRLAVSKETILTDVHLPKGAQPDRVRDKRRTRYRLEPHVYVDLTEVSEKGAYFSQYEVELEIENVLDPDTGMRDDIASLISTYYRFCVETIHHAIYFNPKQFRLKQSNLDQLQEDLMVKMKEIITNVKDNATEFRSSNLSKPIDVDLKQIYLGHLLGRYGTTKVDGKRSLLIQPPGCTLLYIFGSVPITLSDEGENEDWNIIEGETVFIHDRIYFFGFDSLMIEGKSVTNRTYSERYQAMKRVITNTQVDPNVNAELHTKTIHRITSMSPCLPDDFRTGKRISETLSDDVTIPTDGYLFLPDTEYYSEEKLYKWKPSDKLTMDLIYMDGKMCSWGGKYVEFKGNEYTPFDARTDLQHYPWKQDVVYELIYNHETKQLEFYRMREDKGKFPNHMDTVNSIWKHIHRPIPLNLFHGQGLDVQKFHFNRLKDKLYKHLEKVNASTLLDIGSGWGQDVDKWGDFSKIVAVEPNESHCQTLRERIKMKGLQNKVRVVCCGGEDTKRIWSEVQSFIGDRVDAVTSMLSLSFFFQDENHLNDLIRSIHTCLKPFGLFSYLTIDGPSAVRNMMEYGVHIGNEYYEYKTTSQTIQYYPTKEELFIHMNGTIVDHQTEWMVDIGKLCNKGMFQQVMVEKTVHENKNIFNQEEQFIMNMYRVGMMQWMDDSSNDNEKQPKQTSKEKERISTDNEKQPKQTSKEKERISTDNEKQPKQTQKEINKSEHESQKTNEIITVPTMHQKKRYERSFSIREPSIFSHVYSDSKEGIFKCSQKKQRSYTTPNDVRMYPMSLLMDPTLEVMDAIGDGSCAIHAFLTATSERYQSLDEVGKKEMARLLRFQIGQELSVIKDGRCMAKDYFLLEETEKERTPEEYSKKVLALLGNHREYLSVTIFVYLATLFNVNIICLDKKNEQFYISSFCPSSSIVSEDQRAIILLHDNQHYQTVVRKKKENEYQTMFSMSDAVIGCMILGYETRQEHNYIERLDVLLFHLQHELMVATEQLRHEPTDEHLSHVQSLIQQLSRLPKLFSKDINSPSQI